MPYSDPSFDQDVLEILKSRQDKRFLDIGPGAGKYGKMIRAFSPNSYTEAVEVDSSYITQFGLNKIYNKIYNEQIEDFITHEVAYQTDVVTIGDCLEHLKKSDGIDLINYLVYHAKLIIVIFPEKFVQYDWQGHIHEAHNSVWSEKDFENFSYKITKKGFMNLVCIRGYLDDPGANYPQG